MIQRFNEQSKLNTNSIAPYISFEVMDTYDFVSCGFSTRLGGVSKGFQKSMNLGFNLEENRENVLENYRRICESIGILPSQLVFTSQVHETIVLKVDKKDCGKGIYLSRDYDSADGLVTNEKGVALSVFGADCVPLIFLDPIKRVIGTAHASWRDTVGNIACRLVEKIGIEYSSRPEDLQVVICPSICPDCYEVGRDVFEVFEGKYEDVWNKTYNVSDSYKSNKILKHGKEDKGYLNLWLANYVNLTNAGVNPKNIHHSGFCTMCRQDLFFSHRGSQGKRGVMGGFIMLK